MSLRPGGGQRLSRDQLDRLAAELQEQLDQEYTALLSSIEEVQGLMEAEVAGVELLPPLDELESFALVAEAALRNLEHHSFDTKDLITCKGVEAIKMPALKISIATDLDDNRIQSELCSPYSPCSPASCHSLVEQDDADEAALEEAPIHEALEMEMSPICEFISTDDPFPVSSSSRCSPIVSRVAAGQNGSRPRWADLSDDDAEIEATSALQPLKRQLSEQRLPGMQSSSACGQEPARARCGRCMQLLAKDSFSRRAWRQARGLGGAGAMGAAEKLSALCRSCSSEA
jgi:hypothetical protein